ncbi:alpha/beta hydrolase [Planococcus sp. ISL-109]|uniref:alpha/beta hydrolase n=1 Tax=Planococcus sp. ISL-109 TaxID=2819166 RepID=UPI001BEB19C7|nr:alpha/beta hydrolase [Planococcus sp. ISL-109]MBT2582577.1 alpha/beta hydrolase [Planococcus sp. ISL-109]
MWKWLAEGEAKGVVVLIHNAYEEHRRYAWQIEKWRTNGFHVYMGDLPGHGIQASEDGVHREHFFEYDKAAAELLRLAAENVLPIVLIGHGLGAIVAIHALSANRHPVSAVILTSPWFELKKFPAKQSFPLSGISKLGGKRKVDHGIELRHLTRRKFQDGQAKAGEAIYSLSTPAWWKELQSYMEQAGKTQIPDVPVMLNLGQRDLITKTKLSRDWLSTQTLAEFHFKEWPFCYHDLFQEPEREEVFQMSLCFAQAVAESD